MTKSRNYKKVLCFITALIMTTAAYGCTQKKTETDKNTEDTISIESATQIKGAVSSLFSERDLNPQFDTVSAEIILSGDTVTVNGNGAVADGSVVTVSQAGVYHISGKLTDGKIIVNAPKEKVQLVLDNADISCSYSSAIHIENCDKTFLTLAENSVNTLSDGSEYSTDGQENSPDAVIFSEDSLTINGTGSLTVNGNYCDGIHGKDDIVLTGGIITVNAVEDGIKGKDYVAAADGEFIINAGCDGIKSTNSEDEGMGFVFVENGKFTITSGNDGIQAETEFTATGGEFDIVSGGGNEKSDKTHMEGFGGGFGGNRGDFGDKFGGFPNDFDQDNMPENFGQHRKNDRFREETEKDNDNSGTQLSFVKLNAENETVSDTETSDSKKGIKGGTAVNIKGGTFKIDSADDGLHSDGTAVIEDGTLEILAGDDGIHSDKSVEINGGDIKISVSYEGIESAEISISGGNTEVHSSDDGINASDGSSQGGMGAYSDVFFDISGGTLYVNADGDGLDSNGDMTISGGVVLVHGPTNSGNGALDSNGEITVTGGILIAAGSSGMAEIPSDNSTQNCVSVTFESTLSADTMVTLTDSSDNEILCFVPEKQFDNIVISSPEIISGETYKICTGGTDSSQKNGGLYEKGGYKNDGTAYDEFTADSVVSIVGKQTAFGGGFGGHGNFGGGMKPNFDGGERPEMPNSEERPEMPNGDFGGMRPDGNFGGRQPR